MAQNTASPKTPPGVIQTPWEPFGSDRNKEHKGQEKCIHS